MRSASPLGHAFGSGVFAPDHRPDPGPGTPQAWRAQLWLGAGSRGPLTASGIHQAVARRGRQCGGEVWPHRFRHHFSHTWLERGGPEGDLMELNGWSSPQMLARYGASARSARARRTYDRIMTDNP
jgi:integrase